MGILTPLTSLLRKGSDFQSELKRYRAALQRNPNDLDLKSDLIKFILLNRFTDSDNAGDNIQEALKIFESIANAEQFDFQCHYLVGKYYQEAKDIKSAYRVYSRALKRFNAVADKDPNLRAESNEMAYSVALNLMTLQFDPIDPEVEKCFKIIRRSFPLHMKRIEYENEMAKPAPDRVKVKQLVEEIKRLRAEEEQTVLALAAAKAAPPPTREQEPVPDKAPEKKEAETKPPLSKAEEIVEREKRIAAARAALPKIESRSEMAPAKMVKDVDPAVAAPPVEKTPEKMIDLPPAPVDSPKPPPEAKGIFSALFNQMAPDVVGLTAPPPKKESNPLRDEWKAGPEALTLFGHFEAGDKMFMAFHNDQWEGPFTLDKLKEMNVLQPATWVCRAGGQMVQQAYEIPELRPLLTT
jgi:tetratricopeptide (TPR) repeat protein